MPKNDNLGSNPNQCHLKKSKSNDEDFMSMPVPKVEDPILPTAKPQIPLKSDNFDILNTKPEKIKFSTIHEEGKSLEDSPFDTKNDFYSNYAS